MKTFKARKKPIVIEYRQIDSGDYDGMCEIVRWCGGKAVDNDEHVISIATLEGTMYADHDDFIIRGIKGEFYPCKPEIFAATYDYEWPDEQTAVVKESLTTQPLSFREQAAIAAMQAIISTFMVADVKSTQEGQRVTNSFGESNASQHSEEIAVSAWSFADALDAERVARGGGRE